jgi:hypothetical protein
MHTFSTGTLRGKPTYKWEDNIKMVLKYMERESMNLNQLGQ